jgi:hypothetical protein
MAKNWIVLINKIPRGPFSEEDLKVLIQDNIIKKSDLVIEHQKSKEHSSQWLFVWQALELQEPDFEKTQKRAEKKEPQTLSEPILEEELLRITPEELLVRTPTKQFEGELKFKKEEYEDTEDNYTSPTRLPYRSLVFPFVAVIAIAFGIQYTFKFINDSTTQKTVSAPAEVAAPEAPIMATTAKRRTLASPNSPKAKTIPKDNQGLLNIPKQEEPVRQADPEPPPQAAAPEPDRDSEREQEKNVDESKGDDGEIEVTDEVPRKKAKKVKVEEESPEEAAAAEEEGVANPGTEEEDGSRQRIPKL